MWPPIHFNRRIWERSPSPKTCRFVGVHCGNAWHSFLPFRWSPLPLQISQSSDSFNECSWSQLPSLGNLSRRSSPFDPVVSWCANWMVFSLSLNCSPWLIAVNHPIYLLPSCALWLDRKWLEHLYLFFYLIWASVSMLFHLPNVSSKWLAIWIVCLSMLMSTVLFRLNELSRFGLVLIREGCLIDLKLIVITTHCFWIHSTENTTDLP